MSFPDCVQQKPLGVITVASFICSVHPGHTFHTHQPFQCFTNNIIVRHLLLLREAEGVSHTVWYEAEET